MTTMTLMTFPAAQHDEDEFCIDNGPVGEVIATGLEYPWPSAATADDAKFRAMLAERGYRTERGFSNLEAVLSYSLVGGGYAALVVAS